MPDASMFFVLPELADKSRVGEHIKEDPFVLHGVVTAEIVELVPSRLHPQLESLPGGR